MKLPLALIPVACLSLASSGLTQTVTETRTFVQEFYDSGSGPGATVWPLFDLGLEGPTEYTHGQIEHYEVDVTVQWNIRLLVLNNWVAPTEFQWLSSMYVGPEYGDCSPYAQNQITEATDILDPGEVGSLVYDGTQHFYDSGTTFNTFCHSNVWRWQDLFLWNYYPRGPFTYGGGHPVPSDWRRILDFSAVVDGQLTVEWTPDPLPITSVCPGSHTGATGLVAGGDYENLWLLQTGVPNTFNFLLQSDAATSVVPASGLCVGGASGTILRLRDSLTFGGEPFRLPYDAAFAGTTQYFQAWFRTTPGAAATGECIGVTFP